MKELPGFPPCHEEKLVTCRGAEDFIPQSCFPPAPLRCLAASLVTRAAWYQPILVSAQCIFVLKANRRCPTYMQQTAAHAPRTPQSQRKVSWGGTRSKSRSPHAVTITSHNRFICWKKSRKTNRAPPVALIDSPSDTLKTWVRWG